jgi:hypothetical protein
LWAVALSRGSRYASTVLSSALYAEILRDLEEQTGSTRGSLHPQRWFYREEESAVPAVSDTSGNTTVIPRCARRRTVDRPIPPARGMVLDHRENLVRPGGVLRYDALSLLAIAMA